MLYPPRPTRPFLARSKRIQRRALCHHPFHSQDRTPQERESKPQGGQRQQVPVWEVHSDDSDISSRAIICTRSARLELELIARNDIRLPLFSSCAILYEGQVLTMIDAIDGMINMTFRRPDRCSVAEWAPPPSPPHRNSEGEAKPKASPTGFSHQTRRQTLHSYTCSVAHADHPSGRSQTASDGATPVVPLRRCTMHRTVKHLFASEERDGTPKSHAMTRVLDLASGLGFSSRLGVVVLVTDARHPALATTVRTHTLRLVTSLHNAQSPWEQGTYVVVGSKTDFKLHAQAKCLQARPARAQQVTDPQ
jgi:hypothetical protein